MRQNSYSEFKGFQDRFDCHMAELLKHKAVKTSGHSLRLVANVTLDKVLVFTILHFSGIWPTVPSTWLNLEFFKGRLLRNLNQMRVLARF